MNRRSNSSEVSPTGLSFVIALAVLAFPLVAAAQQAQWTVSPYGWGAGVTSNLDVDGSNLIDSTTTIDDLIKKTDFAAMGYLERRSGKRGFYMDAVYLNTGNTQTKSGPGVVQSGTEFKSDLKSTIVDTVFFFRPGGEDRGLDFLIGARIADTASKFDLTPPKGESEHVSSSDTLIDAIAGLRYTALLGDRWDLALRGDIGSGGSKLTWNAQAGFGYWLSKNSSLRFGWKHMAIDFESEADGKTVKLDTKMSGPYIGWMFRN